MISVSNIVLLLAAMATALIAGLFYAYSCSVNPGLGRLSDAGYVAAMQSINAAIQNPVFFLSFFGTAVLLPLAAYLHYSRPYSPRFLCLLAASLIYLTGTLGVTVLGNVPLNESLAGFDLSAAGAGEMLAQRIQFEAGWNWLHSIRTGAAVISLILVLVACLSRDNKERAAVKA